MKLDNERESIHSFHGIFTKEGKENKKKKKPI
jgi:hypothetical protein